MSRSPTRFTLFNVLKIKRPEIRDHPERDDEMETGGFERHGLHISLKKRHFPVIVLTGSQGIGLSQRQPHPLRVGKKFLEMFFAFFFHRREIFVILTGRLTGVMVNRFSPSSDSINNKTVFSRR